MSELPPITDEIPEGELDAEPDHRALDDDGNPVDDQGTDDEA